MKIHLRNNASGKYMPLYLNSVFGTFPAQYDLLSSFTVIALSSFVRLYSGNFLCLSPVFVYLWV
jgi:hypothetical protein